MTAENTGNRGPRAVGGPVLVGVDGSIESLAAVRWAANDAVLRDGKLRILYVDAHEDVPDAAATTHGAEILDGAWRVALAERPELRVATELVHGHPARALADAAGRAGGVLVMGRRGRGAVAGFVLGSVSRDVAGRTAGPTVVVPGHRTPLGSHIVLGVDGSDEAFHAAVFAFDEAALRGVRLTVVQAVTGSIPERSPDLIQTYVPEVELGAARERLSDWAAWWAPRYPEVDVAVAARPGDPAEVLTAAAADAGLVVVGSRGRGRVRGLLLGSVSQSVMTGFPGPVAVIGGESHYSRARGH